MNNCPPELHSCIIQLACTDDGSTVRSLLRVSRYYNAIATPYTFRSLSLCGPERIARVSTLLQRTPSHLRHIHHLFISDKYAGIDEHSSGRQRALSYPPSVARASDICKIIALAAPTLETLAFCGLVDSTSLISQMFRTHFPELRELSIFGFYPFPSSPSTMPKLQRLHLAGNRNPHGLLQLGGVASACPSVSHLRLSGIMGAVAFSEELRAAFTMLSHILKYYEIAVEGAICTIIDQVLPSSESGCLEGAFGANRSSPIPVSECHSRVIGSSFDCYCLSNE
ncbi:hypothetical protein HGRIS_005479 [Hohenbuehelia grisea]|uniref:F-box domain-containing protein n=1 Tax=Hohenbuehelia grisea TaxID=104357 RepID=A0ABR3JX49_9AGAR